LLCGRAAHGDAVAAVPAEAALSALFQTMLFVDVWFIRNHP
jgi:hypothetical protein